MNCPKCYSKSEVIYEYFDSKELAHIKDMYCTKCKSFEVQYQFLNGNYFSEWIK